MTIAQKNRPAAKTLQRWWGKNAEQVVSRLQTFFAAYGFDEVFWSSERPMHFSMRRQRSDLLETVMCEGKETFFSTGFSISSKPAFSLAKSLRLWECSTVFRRLNVTWPSDMDAWPLLYSGMAQLMYHVQDKQPAPVFGIVREDELDSVLTTFEKTYREIAVFAFEVFDNSLVVADFLMGARMPDALRHAVSKKSDLYTGVAREGIYLKAALVYAANGKELEAREAIQHYEKVTRAAFARKQLLQEQYDDNMCEVERIAAYLAASAKFL